MKTLSSLKNNRKSELERYLKNKKYPDYVKVLDEMVSDPKTKSLVEDGFGGYLGDIQFLCQVYPNLNTFNESRLFMISTEGTDNIDDFIDFL